MQIVQVGPGFLRHGTAVVASMLPLWCSCASDFLLPTIAAAAAACPGVGSRAEQNPPPDFLVFLEVA